MRIPTSKVWRAFPELDQFSDVECERFVIRAGREYARSRGVSMLVTVAVLAIFLPVLWMAGMSLWKVVREWVRGRVMVNDYSMAYTMYQGFLAVVIVFGACMFGLIMRDRWLIGTITKKIRSASCRGCGYSLLGLTPEYGVVKCPECNVGFNLMDAGMTLDDLLSREPA